MNHKMNRQNILIILIIASLGYAAFTYWPLINAAFPRPQKSVPQASFLPPAPAATPAASPEAIAQAMISAEVRATREAIATIVDPFILRISVRKKAGETPPGEAKPAEAPKPAEPKLEGVWIDPDMKVAFISGQALPVGGKIMGWRVDAIQKDRVVLARGGATKILKMEENK